MSGRFISGGVHWRIDGDDRPAIARLRSEGLKLLGVLGDLSGGATTSALQRTYPDGIVRVSFFDRLPVVEITTFSQSGDSAERIVVFVDSGLLMLAPPEAHYLEVLRQTQQAAAQAAQQSWLGRLIFDEHGGYRFKDGDRNGASAVDEHAGALPLVLVSGRARLLRQALIGRMDGAGVSGVLRMRQIPDFGLMLSAGRYYCLAVDDGKIHCAALPLREAARKIASLGIDVADTEKREVYILSMADLSRLTWRQIGSFEVEGSPLAYGWNWNWDGSAATMTTHVVDANEAGTYATYTARRYTLTASPFAASVNLEETRQWFPRRQFSNVWFPVGNKVVCLIPPLTSNSYPDTVSYDAPIYSFYRKNGDLCVARINHTYSIASGANEIVLDPYICGIGTTGWRRNYSPYAEHNYSFRLTDSGAEVGAAGYGYYATKMHASLNPVGSEVIAFSVAIIDAGANACPSGSASGVSPDNNQNGVEMIYGKFTVIRVDSASCLSTPRIAIIVSPYDCEAVTIIASEESNEGGTERVSLQINSVPVIYNFTERTVPVYKYMTTNSSPYEIVSTTDYDSGAYRLSYEHAGLQFSFGGSGVERPLQARVFLDPSLEEMIEPQVPPLIRQGAGACWFAQEPMDYSEHRSAQMIDEADVRSMFTGWA